MHCTAVRPVQAVLLYRAEFQKTRTPTTRHLLPAYQKCDWKIWGLCSFSVFNVCINTATCLDCFGLRRRFVSVVFITAHEHDPTTPSPSSSDMQHDFLVALRGTFYLCVVNLLIWPHVQFFLPYVQQSSRQQKEKEIWKQNAGCTGRTERRVRMCFLSLLCSR